MDEMEVLAAMLDKLPVDPQARMGYELLAGGLYWSDEVPKWSFDERTPSQSPPGLRDFRALLNQRSAIILGESQERFQQVWEKAMALCPNWPGFLPNRRDPTLAAECRRRADAGYRSLEELDARINEQQQKAKTNKA